MSKKKFFLLGMASLLGVLAFFFVWKFYLEPSENLKAVYLIPDDAIYFIETEEPVESWNRISNSNFWQHLRTHPYIASLSDNIDALDNFVQKNQKLLDLLGSRQVLVSAHMYRENDYDFLYIVDLKKAAKLAPLRTWFGNFSNQGQRVTYRNYKGQEIIEITDTQTRQVLYLAFVQNLLVASYTNSLVEKSLAQMAEPVIGRDLHFIEADQQTSRSNLFRLYFNYKQLDEYLSIYMDEENEFVKDLSRQLMYSGLGSDLDEQELVSMKGYTTINPEELSHLRALLKAGKGKLKAWEIAPQRTAFYMSVGFSDFSSFVQEVEKVYAKDEAAYEEYLQNMDKIERFLNISIEDNFMSWVDDEMAIVQTQPAGLAQENEFALVLKAKDIDKAGENLAFISKQIRKNTPVRFKSLDYRGYQIRFLSVKGFFKIVLGKFFSKLEKPYYTTINDFVVFSNHPQTLKSIIDDYQEGRTLAGSQNFQQFFNNFTNRNNFLFYLQTPVMFSNLRNMLDGQTWQNFEGNKDYIVCFSDIGFQMTEDGNGFETRLFAQFRPVAQIKQEEQIALAAIRNSLRSNLLDTLVAATAVQEEEVMTVEEISVNDLDARKQQDFYENGELQRTISIKNGLKHGLFREYYENGELKVKGRFREGEMDGTWRFYDEEGKLLKKVRYRNGKEV